MVAPPQNTTKNGVSDTSRQAILLAVLAFTAVALYISLDDKPASRQAIVPSSMDEKQIAEAIRKQSAPADQDADSPKKVLTPEEIESGKW